MVKTRKRNNREWKEWLQSRPGMEQAVRVVLGVVLALLVLGIVVAAFRFVWSGIVLIALVALALLAVAKLRRRGVKIPDGFTMYRNVKDRLQRAEAKRKRSV